MPWTKEQMAERAAREIEPGSIVLRNTRASGALPRARRRTACPRRVAADVTAERSGAPSAASGVPTQTIATSASA